MPYLLLAAATAITIPAMVVRLAGIVWDPPVEAAVFGAGILGAAFLLSWAAELAQLEISQSLAVAILAFIAVLPEYAVDLYFAYVAAERPEYAAYATANMTGANRLLVGLGWPVVVLLFVLRFRRRSVVLHPSHAVEIAYLGLATVYCFVIPLKGSLTLLDTAILFALFGGYIVRSSRTPMHEPELVGPAAALARWSRGPRRGATLGLFLFSGVVIVLSAEPFAEALVASGEPLGIDEFLLVQWVAPLASEAPEFIIASMWALRGDVQAGLGALISSKVNQWTLLIGTIPLVYSIGLGRVGELSLDVRQEHELWLTAAQSLFAVAVLADRRLGGREAMLLFALFTVQFVFPDTRVEVTLLYGMLAVFYLIWYRRLFRPLLRSGVFRPRPRG